VYESPQLFGETEMAFKILLVDDKLNDRNDDISQLPNLLRKAGYDVKATADGEAA
jgi:hypothetical protein